MMIALRVVVFNGVQSTALEKSRRAASDLRLRLRMGGSGDQQCKQEGHDEGKA
jgi:hypothetical protein